MARNPLVVHGLRDLIRTSAKIGKEARIDLDTRFRRVVEPVRADSEALHRSNITRIGDRWSRMRTGVTQKVVYVAPKSRNRGGPKRKNLAPLLLRNMETSLERHRADVEQAAERTLDEIARKWETG